MSLNNFFCLLFLNKIIRYGIIILFQIECISMSLYYSLEYQRKAVDHIWSGPWYKPLDTPDLVLAFTDSCIDVVCCCICVKISTVVLVFFFSEVLSLYPHG